LNHDRFDHESYMQFCIKQKNKIPHFYLIDENLNIITFNNKMKKIDSISLNNLLNLSPEQPLSSKTSGIKLISREIFVDKEWHKILLIVLPLAETTIMAFDITDVGCSSMVHLWTNKMSSEKISDIEIILWHDSEFVV